MPTPLHSPHITRYPHTSRFFVGRETFITLLLISQHQDTRRRSWGAARKPVCSNINRCPDGCSWRHEDGRMAHSPFTVRVILVLYFWEAGQEAGARNDSFHDSWRRARTSLCNLKPPRRPPRPRPSSWSVAVTTTGNEKSHSITPISTRRSLA